MATKNKRGYGNPYASSDLGSGAKTTTGGSYTNPRLGIQDYTAFGRGFGSTFQLPEGEEKESIDIPDIDLAGEKSKKNKFFTVDGVEYNIDDTASKLFMNNFKNDTSEDGLLGIQNRIINTKQGSPEYKALLNKSSQYNQVFGANPDSNLSYLFSTISDPSKVDFEASKKYGNIMLPGVNPRENSKYSINVMAKRFHEGRLTPATRTHDGIEWEGVKDIDTGEFINLGAADKNWVNTNIKSFYNISDNILANYDSVKEMVKSFKPIEFKEKTFQDSQGKEFQVTEETQYYREGQINNFERQSNVFANNEFKAILESDELPSAIRQINELIDNGYFAEPPAGNDKFNVLTHKQNIENFIAKGGAEDDPIYDILQERYHQARVKDYLNENFKLSNGAGFYNIDDREATKGRSVARIKANAEFFETSKVEQKETIDTGGDGSGYSGVFFDIFGKGMGDMEMPLVFGEKSAGKSLITSELGKDAYKKLFNVNAYNEQDVRNILKSTFGLSDKAINKKIDAYYDIAPNNLLWTLEKDDFKPQPAIDGTLQGWANMMLSEENSPLGEVARRGFRAQFEAFKNDPANEKFFRGDDIYRGNPDLIPPIPKSSGFTF